MNNTTKCEAAVCHPLDDKRILVVTPTLGDSPFLAETVASLAAQRVRILHVIAVPAAKVSQVQARFPHAHVCADAGRAGGIYGAINAGLHAASTLGAWDWFTYINDDDTLLPGFSTMLERHARRDTAEREGVLYGDVELIDEERRRLSRITTEPDPRWLPALLQQGISPLMQQGMLFRRAVVERIQGFDARYRLCGDLDFWLRAYINGARFRHYPLSIAQFRLRRGQLSGNTTTTEAEQDEIVARHLPQPEPALRKYWARVKYRWYNLPRYVARLRTRGFQTSYQLLRTESARR